MEAGEEHNLSLCLQGSEVGVSTLNSLELLVQAAPYGHRYSRFFGWQVGFLALWGSQEVNEKWCERFGDAFDCAEEISCNSWFRQRWNWQVYRSNETSNCQKAAGWTNARIWAIDSSDLYTIHLWHWKQVANHACNSNQKMEQWAKACFLQRRFLIAYSWLKKHLERKGFQHLKVKWNHKSPSLLVVLHLAAET